MRVLKYKDVISCAHCLNIESPCSRVHGHNYVVEIEIVEKDDSGDMVVDFNQLKELLKLIDHRIILNSAYVSLEQDAVKYHWKNRNKTRYFCKEDAYIIDDEPTVENISKHICSKIYELLKDKNRYKVKVTVSESEKGSVSYVEDEILNTKCYKQLRLL